MRNPRPSAWALMGVLVATSSLAPITAPAVLAAPDYSICSPGHGPTRWASDLVPPDTIRVLRSDGPNAGHVETVPFFKYVGTVVKTEYSGTGTTGPVWFRTGAQAVKQYGWYYARKWRGGRVSFTVTDPNSGATTTTTECYDVNSTTADQLYKPEKWDPTLEAWVPKNIPGADHLQAMREMWHVSLRKWKVKKKITYMWLTGYRSGTKVPCGTDRTGSRMYQKSLRDCVTKGLTLEETMRRYYEPFYSVDSRGHDSIGDSNTYFGDLGLLTNDGGNVRWHSFPGAPDRFGADTSGIFNVSWSSLVGQGVGNVHRGRDDQAGLEGDSGLLADLLFVTSNNRLWLAEARSNGNGYASPTSTSISGAPVAQLLVADFNGDLLVDAGLLRDTGGGNASLHVMRSLGDGSFGNANEWWSGPLDLASNFVAAGDVNGDGKADLIMRNASGVYSTAASSASCDRFNTWGSCPSNAIGQSGLGVATTGFSASWSVDNVKNVVGDYDRDGRDDVIAFMKNGSGSKVVVLRSKGDGTFAAPQELWSGAVSFDSTVPVAMDVDPDGVADVALINTSQSRVTWLMGVERRKAYLASMTHMSNPRSDAAFTTTAKPF